MNYRDPKLVSGLGLLGLLTLILVPVSIQAAETTGAIYPLNTCPVTGAQLGTMGDPIRYNYEGREIRFCCQGCEPEFKADPEKYRKKIDAEIIEQQKKDYPLDTCVVTGQKLGSMGDPVDLVHNNQLVRFCCKGCVSKFKADPETYLKKIDEAVIAKQKDGYPLDTCVVSGQKLGGAMGDPIDYVYGNRLIRFCCPACIKTFEKNPAEYLKKLEK